VPRFYLTPDHREEIVRRRALWGSEIYTDDSDVIAACVHSGWVRGEWGDDVDVSMLDLIIGDTAEGASQRANDQGATKEPDKPISSTPPVDVVIKRPPSTGPMIPPPNCDLNVTILILPTLESYASTVSRGIRSRSWSKNHDGLSFKIEHVKWVESMMGARERGGEARRKRMKTRRDEVLSEEGSVGIKVEWTMRSGSAGEGKAKEGEGEAGLKVAEMVA
jgi:Histone deacetylation protein Rxt3